MHRQMAMGIVLCCTLMFTAVSWAAPPRHVVGPVGYHGAALHHHGCGCESCAPACDPCCTPCCLQIIPKVVKGVGCLVHELFSCHRYYDPCCGAVGGCAGGCAGCADRGVPVHEEVLAPSPAMSYRTRQAYDHWSMSPAPSHAPRTSGTVRRPVTPTAAPRGESSVVRPRTAATQAPARVPSHTASTRTRLIEAEEIEEEAPQVRRTSYTESASAIPHNPLRAK